MGENLFGKEDFQHHCLLELCRLLVPLGLTLVVLLVLLLPLLRRLGLWVCRLALRVHSPLGRTVGDLPWVALWPMPMSEWMVMLSLLLPSPVVGSLLREMVIPVASLAYLARIRLIEVLHPLLLVLAVLVGLLVLLCPLGLLCVQVRLLLVRWLLHLARHL